MSALNQHCTAANLGNNIRLWRMVKGYKQQQFADMLGISRPALSNIETGRTDITCSRLRAIANALQIEVTQLFTGTNAATNHA